MKQKISAKSFVLSFQHVLAMFGATVLVPFITGLDPSIALLGAGVGTLIFHFVTGGKVPVFLGSSFAFISGILIVKETFGIEYATGAFLGVGAVYLIMSAVIYFVGVENVQKLFPAVVTGPIIIVIGLILAPVAVDMASANWTIAIITILGVALTGILGRGFVKMIPILVGILIGYLAAALMGQVDFSAIQEAKVFAAPTFMKPAFSADAMKIIVPIALVTLIEHIGDITTNGAVVGKDFMKEPGLHRTILGDGLATAFAGLIGAPANTTYGENTGVLAVTKNYNPAILRGAAVIAVLLSFIGKFGAIVQSIPVPVMGGVSFVLFGMIASIGVRTMVDTRLDLGDLRNSIIVFTILIVGIVSIKGDGNAMVIQLTELASLSGLSLAAVIGVTLNAVLNIIIPKFIKELEPVKNER